MFTYSKRDSKFFFLEYRKYRHFDPPLFSKFFLKITVYIFSQTYLKPLPTLAYRRFEKVNGFVYMAKTYIAYRFLDFSRLKLTSKPPFYFTRLYTHFTLLYNFF